MDGKTDGKPKCADNCPILPFGAPYCEGCDGCTEDICPICEKVHYRVPYDTIQEDHDRIMLRRG